MNGNTNNLSEIQREGWLIDWVERAREEINPLGFIQAFFPQKLFNLFSVFLPLAVLLLNLAMRVTSISLPNFPFQVASSLTKTSPQLYPVKQKHTPSN